jgi:hypothetical protein
MASKAFRAIEAGMKDAIAYLDGDKTKGVATISTLPNWGAVLRRATWRHFAFGPSVF